MPPLPFTYAVYLLIAVGIIRWIGVELYRVGGVYIRYLIADAPTGDRLNRLLLLGYYLVNIGYAVLALTQGQEQIIDLVSAYEWLTYRIGLILLILGLLHANNMLLIYLFFARKRFSPPTHPYVPLHP